MKLTRIGVDLAKQVFQIHGVDRQEQSIRRRRWSRERWLSAVAEVAALDCEKRHVEFDPEGLDDPTRAWAQDHYISYWTYPGGACEIDDDIWSLFVLAKGNNTVVMADAERALLATGQFVKVPVDFAQFR